MAYKTQVKLNIDIDLLINKTFTSEKLRDAAREVFKDYDARQELGFRFIDEIVSRTQNENTDKNDRPFKVYSESYKKSAAFSIYGKNKNNVNLTLTEEMLSSMTAKSSLSNITISFVSESQAAKAHGHINGTRSKNGKRQLPVRDFFGLSQESKSKLLKETMKDYNQKRIAEFA